MPRKEMTGVKRGLPPSMGSVEESDLKKIRRSNRIKSDSDPHTPIKANAPLPSPLTHLESTATERIRDTVTPPSPVYPRSQKQHFPISPSQNSPPYASNLIGSQRVFSDTQKTQPFSQVIYPPPGLAYEVEDEEGEGVWGYLLPFDTKAQTLHPEPLVLKERQSCPSPKSKAEARDPKGKVSKDQYENEEAEYEKSKQDRHPSRGYLIGRHPECDLIIEKATISNRHALIFSEVRGTVTFAVLEDTSGNGTFINDALVGRNNRRELHDGDEISIVDEATFCFRYPRHRESGSFKQQYNVLSKLGKGHFATVYLCVDNSTGSRWAVKKFERRKGSKGDKSRMEGLQQEVAVLMSVSHPSLLCLKGAFEEDDGFYLILELAAEGELFNWIVLHQKLSEADTRKIFVQLFKAVKYLHERNIVHRDIKPENILLADKDLTVKLADFGLAKIIGEESFTTTLCGTPSYVAPEILKPGDRRRYTRAVDIWSLGVVLYICLCGFPPFSDELYTPENPYTLAEQIIQGRYDFPSPYWDSVGDPALDLIERMLTVDPEKRITVDECLEHPWTTGQDFAGAGASQSMISTDGLLAGRMGQLDVSRRKVQRERTLLSSLNEVKISKIIEDQNGARNKKQPPVTVFEKNEHLINTRNGNGYAHAGAEKNGANANADKVGNGDMMTPGNSGERFLATGEKDDAPLFAEDGSSIYPDAEEFQKKVAKTTKPS